MRLATEEAQQLMACLAALKNQRHALANRIDDVKGLLQALEAADEAAVHEQVRQLDGPYTLASQRSAAPA